MLTKKQKHILIVAHHYPPHISGVGMVAHNQAKRLVKMGHMVTVITSETSKQEKSDLIEGVKVIRIKAINILEKWDIPFPIFYPKLIAALIREIKKVDIVHIHDVFYVSSFFAAFFAHLYKKRIVLTEHIALIAHSSKFVVFIEKMVYATTGRLIFKLSDLILVYNNTVEEFLRAKGVSNNKIFRLINGVDNTIFHPVTIEKKTIIRNELGLNEDKKIILFVGRFVYKKGFTKVLAAQSKKYQVVFAGGDALKKNTEEVVFLGKLLPAEIAQVYQAADIFVLPSESEGFPLSTQEAMACGLPIITTNDEGYDSYSLDKNNIYFIDNPTDTSVRQSIEAIVFDDAKLKKMGNYSKKYSDENFNWDISTAKLDEFYTGLLDKKTKKIKDRKIAFISDAVYPFFKGGKEKRLYDITTRLAREGNDVTIYCMKWWKGSKIIKRDNVTLHAISPYYPMYSGERRSIGQAVYFSIHCFKLINQSFDIMDVDHIPHLVLFTTKLVCVLKRKKMIATWHEVWGKKYWQSYLGTLAGFVAYIIEKISVILPNKIVSVSSHTTNDLKSILGVKKEIITIPNGIDIESIKGCKPGVSSDILFVGRLLSHKNVDVLLESISVLKNRNNSLHALIIGDGPEMEYLKKITKELNLEENITFYGFVEDQTTVYSMMKSTKVFVLPSLREGFGITVIEANAAGTPVVTIDSKQNAAKELIIDNENGVTCILDKNKLADAIEKVLLSRKSPEFYTDYAKRYNWEEIIGNVEKVYI